MSAVTRRSHTAGGRLRDRGAPQTARWAATAAILLAAVAVAILLLARSGDYRLVAQFTDAGQLVRGDLVTVGGVPVGSVRDISLAPNGLADIELGISDRRLVPLRQGTVVSIGQLSLTGEANRFVDLAPGPAGAPPLRSGAALPLTRTHGIVDLDALLDSLTPQVRNQLKELIRQGAQAVSGHAARQFSAGLSYLDPALAQTASTARQLLLDPDSLRRLVAATAQLSAALAPRREDIAGSVHGVAATLRAVAARDRALDDALVRAPAVFTQARGLLTVTDRTLDSLDPTLRALRPVVPRAATLLQRLYPVSLNALPAIRGVQRLLGPAARALRAAAEVAPDAIASIDSITRGIGPLLPVVAGLRAYMPDLIGGLFQGVSGNSGGAYDANGHYIRSGFSTGQSGGITALIPPLTGAPQLSPRYGLTARCPGGASEPAPDGSNPWTSGFGPDTPAGICRPGDDHR